MGAVVYVVSPVWHHLFLFKPIIQGPVNPLLTILIRLIVVLLGICVVNLLVVPLLYDLTIVRNRHLQIGVLEVALDLLPDHALFLILFGQLINEIVQVGL